MTATKSETNQEEHILLTEFTPAQECLFYRNANGFLGLKLRGEDHRRVQLSRALPFTAPGQYLCVADMEDKEVAVLESLALFDDDARTLLEAELDIRYFYPEVTKIASIKEKSGAYYFSLTAGGRESTVTVKDISKNLKQLGEGKLILTDVDGNRYLIPDVYKIQKKSLRMLEPYLY